MMIIDLAVRKFISRIIVMLSQIVINVPLWYYASHVLLLRVINQRTKRKFVFARPSKATKTLLK